MTTEAHQKSKVLELFLENAAFDGWSKHSLTHSVEQAGLDKNYAEILFPKGVDDIVCYYIDSLNKQLEEKILNMPDFTALKVRDKITTLVWERIQLMHPHKLAIKQLSYYFSHPVNFCLASQCAWSTVDAMWHTAKDVSVDFNYYTKRATLLGVYSTTLLYWLKDTSEDANDTKGFLSRRINNVMEFHKQKSKALSFFQNFYHKTKYSA